MIAVVWWHVRAILWSLWIHFHLVHLKYNFGKSLHGEYPHVTFPSVQYIRYILYSGQLDDMWFNIVHEHQFILPRVFIFRMQHGSWCRCRMYGVSTSLIREDHFYATWRRTCLGSEVSCWCRQFFSDTAGSGFKGQPISPSAWLVQIKPASRRSPAAPRYQQRLLELRSHRATGRQPIPANYRHECFKNLK